MTHSARPIGMFAAALAASVATPAFAQDMTVSDTEMNRDRVTVGLGVGVVPRYEGADDYRIVPAPVARGTVSGITFTLQGPRLYVDLVPKSDSGWDLQLGPVAGVNFNRTAKDNGDPRINALGKLDPAIELGGYVGIGKTGVLTSAYDTLSFDVSYVHDVNNVHDSHVIQPEISYGTPLSRKAFVGVSASAQYVGDNYAQTYFGITPAQSAASGLAPYTVDHGWKSWGLGLVASHSLTGDLLHGLSFVAAGSYRRLLGDFADSPIVTQTGSPNQWMGAVGLAYTF